MAKPFHELRERLLCAGIAPRHVRRYISELTDHLADLTAEEQRAGHDRAEAESAALIRIGGIDDLAKAMVEQRQLQSWSVRAPWATFGVAPFLLLAAAWSVALFILWSGWQIFLPGVETPFGIRVYGLGNLYFQFGRSIYLGAPILIGWGILLIAARQRLKSIWPAVGLVLIAWIGGTGQVHASRPGGGIYLTSAVLGYSYGLFHALVILSISTLPYLIWRFKKARVLSIGG